MTGPGVNSQPSSSGTSLKEVAVALELTDEKLSLPPKPGRSGSDHENDDVGEDPDPLLRA